MSRSPPVLRPVRWTAAAEGWVEDLQRLLADGAEDVDERGGPTQCTPLQIAAQQGHRAVALLLLEAGADVSATDSIGASPIHYAAQEGHEDVSFLLILRGAEVRAKVHGGGTALQHATAYWGREAVTMLLIEFGLRPMVDRQRCITLLKRATRQWCSSYWTKGRTCSRGHTVVRPRSAPRPLEGTFRSR